MTRLLSTLLTLPLVLALAAVAAVVFSLESNPLVQRHPDWVYSDAQRAQRLLRRQMPGGNTVTVAKAELSEPEINLALNYLLRRHLDGRARVALSPGVLHGEFTWRFRGEGARSFLNLSLALRTRNDRVLVEDLRLGRLHLPLEIDGQTLADLLGRIFRREEIPLLHAGVRRLVIQPERLTLYYQYDPGMLNHARRLSMDEAERTRVLVHYRALADRLRNPPEQLAPLLRDALGLAAERSRSSGDEPRENRAALVALGLYALGSGAERLLGAREELPPLPRKWVTLQGREDLARHFLVSAAISATSDSTLSDAMGLYKEWKDSQGGSGFSFVDLAADRAGTRFGTAATADSASARRLLRIASAKMADQDLLPPVGDLPEQLSQVDFQREFGGIDGAGYQRMLETIERRLDTLPIYNKNRVP
jgi:hypothetical protein